MEAMLDANAARKDTGLRVVGMGWLETGVDPDVGMPVGIGARISQTAFS